MNSTKFTLNNGILINILHELDAWCTSIVAEVQEGIIHSRNLDFFHADKLRKIIYRAHFVNNNEKKFEAVMFALGPGVVTAMKPGAFSISENTRRSRQKVGLVENIYKLFSGH